MGLVVREVERFGQRAAIRDELHTVFLNEVAIAQFIDHFQSFEDPESLGN